MPRSGRLDEDALSRAARRDLLIAGAVVLVAAALFSTVVWRPASLTDAVVRDSRSMNPFVAVALGAAALGLVGLATGRRPAVTVAGSAVVLFGVVAFLSSTLGLDVGVGALLGRRPGYSGPTAFVPTTSTVCLLLLGAAELLGASPRHWRARSARLGLLGMSVVALALIGGVADLLALAPPYTLGRGAPMSPVTALALATLGGAVTLTAWRSSGGSAAGRAPGWFPAVVGLGAACAALVLWWSAAGQERADVGRRVDLATRMMAGDLHSHLALLSARVGTVAERGGLNGGASSPAWRAEAGRLVREAGSPVAAIGWVAASRDARASLVAGDPAALEAFAPALPARASWDAVPGGGAVAAPAPVAVHGDTDVALFVPTVPGAAGGAGVMVVVRPDTLLAQLLGGGPSRGFEYQLRLGTAVVGAGPRGQTGARSLARTLPVDPGAPRWTLTVRPLPAGLVTMKTSLDELVLAVGLTVAGLLALMARLWQQARARALEVEIANRQLAADMVRHERLEAQLRQSQKMEAVGQLTGGIAHDLNNVLTIVSANAELMAAALPGDTPELRSELAQLRSAASRGATMVRQLLAFSRRKPLVPGPLDLVRVVDESSEMLRRLVPEHIVIRVTHAAPRLPVMGDAGAVEQVLVNLVTNARDAMPGGGTLRLETRRATLAADRAAALGMAGAGELGCLVIADSGVGMDAATRERAFEPFFTTKEPGAGTGLGLSMVYALVQQLGGAIELDSAPRQGTTATVYLPAATGEGTPPAAPRPPATLAGHETILVVEDEAGIRRAAQRVLERHGYRVLLAENGEQGLALYRQHAADIALVISDVVMPRMGGRELYETLRGDGARVRFLFASGYASPGTDDAPSLAGVPQIAKPWTIDELLGRVREVLDGKDDREVRSER